ncbi:RHS repeat-associated core domain-containing protein [Pseudomonas sp. MLB6B]
MSDAFWAAREGDALLHTSMLADIVGGVLEIAATAAIGALATAAVASAFGLTVATGGLGCFVLGAVVGVVVGVAMAKTGADTGLSRLCEGIGNALSPPTVQATIATGSRDTHINGKPAARAAGIVLAPLAPLENEQAAAQAQANAEEETFLDMAKGFFSQLWRPTVASPAPNTQEANDDKVLCSKHPPMPPQYLAEGSSKVMINGHPAVRSGDRSTCEAVVADGGLVSDNVRIGGEPIVVREIRSGKTPGVGLAVSALMLLRGRGSKFFSQFGCMLIGGVATYLTEQVGTALVNATAGSPNPVHSPTGAKVLEGPLELDFTLPTLLPIAWQRFYNSRDERHGGLLGPGWSVEYEVFVEIIVDAHGESLRFIDDQGRIVELGAIALGEAVFSAGEGLSVRRAVNGEVLIERTDGLYRLFEPSDSDSHHLRLAQLGDRNDNRLHLIYDGQNRLSALRDTHGHVQLALDYVTAPCSRLSTVRRLFADGSEQILVRYAYDAAANLTHVFNQIDALCRTFAYDDGCRLVEHWHSNGLRCHYTWMKTQDGWRVSRHWTDEGDEYHFDYDIDNGITRIVDGLNRQSTCRWNEQYQITRYEDPLGRCWSFEWNDERLLLSATNPAGDRWTYLYDASGNLVQTSDPMGRSDATEWLEHWSLPRSETDAAGNRWTYAYDQRGNCIRKVDPLGNVTHLRYDPQGQLIEQVDARGNRLGWQRNEQGQIIRHTDCSGATWRYTYDKQGFLSKVTDATGESTCIETRADGLQFTVTRPLQQIEVLQYDVRGELISHRDASGRLREYHYNPHGLLARLVLNGVVLHRYGYDSYERLQWMENERSERYQFVWDDADRLMSQQYIDGTRHAYRYDDLDNLLEITMLPASGHADGPIVHRFEHDAGERLVARHTADGTTRYEYDALDQLTHVRFFDNEGNCEHLRFAFDALGRVVEEVAGAVSIEHAFDELGNLLRTRLPDNRWINRLRYGTGHLHQINIDGRVIVDFKRDRLHRETTRTQGALTGVTEYDRLGRPVVFKQFDVGKAHPLPSVQRIAFTYDVSNRLTERAFHTTTQHRTQRYRYDLRDFIVNDQADQRADESLRYDKVGNLVDNSRERPDRHLLTYRGTTYRYDGFGRLSEKRSAQSGVQTFSYDAEHRLVKVTSLRDGRTRIVAFRYDPLGRRTEKSDDVLGVGSIERVQFVWDGFTLLQEVRNGHPTVYINEDYSHTPIARLDGQSDFQAIRHYTTDVNGAPLQLHDEDGTLLWWGRYRVWGELQEEGCAPCFIEQQNLRFQGQYADRNTGIHYNTFRYYDPLLGRFVTPDPIGVSGGLNLYHYAPNPLGWIDPLGWKKKCSFRKPKRVQSKSTGRTRPRNRNEAFALDHVKKHPENGLEVIAAKDIKDRHFKGKGWAKWERKVNGVNIHYMAKVDRTGTMKEVTDFKIKD